MEVVLWSLAVATTTVRVVITTMVPTTTAVAVLTRVPTVPVLVVTTVAEAASVIDATSGIPMPQLKGRKRYQTR